LSIKLTAPAMKSSALTDKMLFISSIRTSSMLLIPTWQSNWTIFKVPTCFQLSNEQPTRLIPSHISNNMWRTLILQDGTMMYFLEVPSLKSLPKEIRLRLLSLKMVFRQSFLYTTQRQELQNYKVSNFHLLDSYQDCKLFCLLCSDGDI